ncbi:MAG: c-type cytochrome [Polaromonas sp.]|nr:c-type cytochrome [Polaromonas sp.]
MFSFRNAAVAAAVMAGTSFVAAQSGVLYPGLGRTATPKEVAAWDIDVRPDFKGLPVGSGSVSKGQDVWEGKCAQCHGVFGDSNEVFSPLIGGTTADDIKTGRVAKLKDSTAGRTTIMKVATLSTLWDYIHRAMPWTQPKSLSTDEVYSVTAFLLNLAGVVPDNFTLSDKNIAEVQARMPNRNGMTTEHALWPGNEFHGTKAPDVKNTACMKDCATEFTVTSFLPDFARNAHGNLAQQNRTVGAQHGADTTRPENKGPVSSAAALVPVVIAQTAAGGQDSKIAQALTQKNSCAACHAVDRKILGPSFADIAKKYPGQADYLVGKIKSGGTGVWGPIPMPAQSLADVDAKVIASWLAAGAAK